MLVGMLDTGGTQRRCFTYRLATIGGNDVRRPGAMFGFWQDVT